MPKARSKTLKLISQDQVVSIIDQPEVLAAHLTTSAKKESSELTQKLELKLTQEADSNLYRHETQFLKKLGIELDFIEVRRRSGGGVTFVFSFKRDVQV